MSCKKKKIIKKYKMIKMIRVNKKKKKKQYLFAYKSNVICARQCTEIIIVKCKKKKQKKKQQNKMNVFVRVNARNH